MYVEVIERLRRNITGPVDLYGLFHGTLTGAADYAANLLGGVTLSCARHLQETGHAFSFLPRAARPAAEHYGLDTYQAFCRLEKQGYLATGFAAGIELTGVGLSAAERLYAPLGAALTPDIWLQQRAVGERPGVPMLAWPTLKATELLGKHLRLGLGK